MPLRVVSRAISACSVVYVLVLSQVSPTLGFILLMPFSVAFPTFSAVFCTACPVL